MIVGSVRDRYRRGVGHRAIVRHDVGVRRRRFLTSLAAVVATACSGLESDPSTSPTTGATPPPPTDPPSTSADTTGPVESAVVPEPDLPAVEPLPSPPSPLGPDGFGLGVASGDPDAGSVVLWTRLVGDLPDGVDVVWELGTDPDLASIVATGVVSASSARGHSLHVVADGLTPDRRWYYRFRSGEQTSPVGRTRTLPDPAGIVDPDRPIVVGASSCQRIEDGRWAALNDVAAAELDLFVWLGDSIYEDPDDPSLDGYRRRYAEYRRQPELQAAHAAHPWFITWDDHEVLNDYDAGVDPTRRAAAYQAWWEFMPVRLPPPDPDDDHYDIFRFVDLGDRLRLLAVDVRQYADDTTLFGEAQKAWLTDALRHDRTWTLLASPVVASGIYTGGEVLLPYTLDGHPDERLWLGELLARQPGRIIVSGDLHAAAVFEFSPDRRDVDSPTVATEFMAPPISSAFPTRYAAAAPLLPALNSHMKRFDLFNGWLSLAFTAVDVTAEFRRVADVSRPDSDVSAERRYRVELGDPGIAELD